MRKSHRFCPDALDDELEDRRVLSQLTALAPLAANVATYNTMFGVGAQFTPAVAVMTPTLTTGFASPLFNSFVSTGAGLDNAFSNPNYLNGLGVYGPGLAGGAAGLSGANLAVSPVSTLAINGGLLGVGALPPTSGVVSFSGANYAPTALAIQSGLYPTVLQPGGGLAYYTGTGFTPFTPSTLFGTNYYSSNYTNGVGYLNGLGVGGGLGTGFNSGVSPLGLYGLSGDTLVNTPYGFNSGIDLTNGLGLATTSGSVNNGDILDLSPGLMNSVVTPAFGGGTTFSANPYVSSAGLGTAFTTSPYVNPNGMTGTFGMMTF